MRLYTCRRVILNFLWDVWISDGVGKMVHIWQRRAVKADWSADGSNKLTLKIYILNPKKYAELACLTEWVREKLITNYHVWPWTWKYFIAVKPLKNAKLKNSISKKLLKSSLKHFVTPRNFFVFPHVAEIAENCFLVFHRRFLHSSYHMKNSLASFANSKQVESWIAEKPHWEYDYEFSTELCSVDTCTSILPHKEHTLKVEFAFFSIPSTESKIWTFFLEEWLNALGGGNETKICERKQEYQHEWKRKIEIKFQTFLSKSIFQCELCYIFCEINSIRIS